MKLRDEDRKGAEVEARRIAEDSVRDAMIRFEMIRVRADIYLVVPVAEVGDNLR